MRRTIFHEDHDAFRGTLRQFVDRTLKPRYERHPPHRRLPAVHRRVRHRGIEYTKDRRAFGQPIGSFQHNKFKLAELVTKIEVTQAFAGRPRHRDLGRLQGNHERTHRL